MTATHVTSPWYRLHPPALMGPPGVCAGCGEILGAFVIEWQGELFCKPCGVTGRPAEYWERELKEDC